MKTIIYSGSIDKHYPSVHVALGNFDGVHLGHQKLIRELVKEARRNGGTAVVATFEPHPLRVIRPDNPPQMLTPTTLKASLIGRMGVDVVLLLPFDCSWAQMSPEAFVQTVLVDHLRAESVFVGFNYSFGRGGKGTPQQLWQLGRFHGFRVKVIEAVTQGGMAVSSTRIRTLLADGQVTEAAGLLGYSPILQGEVVTGDQRGRQIGFPTANLQVPPGQYMPARGVYTARISGAALPVPGWPAVVNIGVKPTFVGDVKETIEAHLLDYSGDLYGTGLTLQMLHRLRPEQRFASPDALVQQIERDILTARQQFRQYVAGVLEPIDISF